MSSSNDKTEAMQKDIKTQTLLEFLEYPLNSTKEIFDRFASLPGAVRVDGCVLSENINAGSDSGPVKVDVFFPQAGFVFVKGSRPDAATLVADADTIWRGSWKSETFTYTDEGEEFSTHLEIEGPNIDKPKNDIAIIDDTIRSTDERCGIGAEGRAGCAMLWLLRDLGHNLLILDGMVDNRLGAQAIRDKFPEIRKQIADSSFLMQFSCERRNEFDFCKMPNTYEFLGFIADETGFDFLEDARSYTEAINVVNDIQDICGVNMPGGYYNAGKPDEYLIVSEWLNVLSKIEKMLSKPLERYVRDENRVRPYFSPYGLYEVKIVFPPKRQNITQKRSQ